MNEIVFAENYAAQLQSLAEVSKRKKLLDKQEKELKEELLPLMEEHGITSINTDYLTISYIGESETVDLDKSRLKAEDPERYNALLNDYNKRVMKKAYLRFNAK